MTSEQQVVAAMSQEIAELKQKLAATEKVVCALDDGNAVTSKGILILAQQMQKMIDKVKVMEGRFWGDDR